MMCSVVTCYQDFYYMLCSVVTCYLESITWWALHAVQCDVFLHVTTCCIVLLNFMQQCYMV